MAEEARGGVLEPVDQNALKANQAGIVLFVLAGFVANQPWFPAGVAAVLLVGSAFPPLGVFSLVYRRVLVRFGLVRPFIVRDQRAPHRFAQLLGGTFLTIASLLLFRQESTAGWALAGVVVLLAAVNLFFNFCTGCFVYYQLGKLGVPGFTSRILAGGQDAR